MLFPRLRSTTQRFQSAGRPISDHGRVFGRSAIRCWPTTKVEIRMTSRCRSNLGTHPYFRVPLGGTSHRRCRVRIARGICLGVDEAAADRPHRPGPGEGSGDRHSISGAMQLDNVFGGVRFENHRAAATVEDPASRRTMTLSFDDRFTTCVVYNPPHRQAVCIEPYTSVPDSVLAPVAGHRPAFAGAGSRWQVRNARRNPARSADAQ